MSCNILGFRFIFSGTQLFDEATSSNEDHKVWRPLWFHTKACTCPIIFTVMCSNYKSQPEKLRYWYFSCPLNKQYFCISSFACFCVPILWLACGACGGNKCHWCIVAIVERRNRYRGISHKRGVESSGIGWLSCMLGKPSQRYRHTSTGSAWEKVQNL